MSAGARSEWPGQQQDVVVGEAQGGELVGELHRLIVSAWTVARFLRPQRLQVADGTRTVSWSPAIRIRPRSPAASTIGSTAWLSERVVSRISSAPRPCASRAASTSSRVPMPRRCQAGSTPSDDGVRRRAPPVGEQGRPADDDVVDPGRDRVALDDVGRRRAAADPAAAAAGADDPGLPRTTQDVGDQGGHRRAAGVLGRGERRRAAHLHLDVADGHLHDVVARPAPPSTDSKSASKSRPTTSGKVIGRSSTARAAWT